MIYEQAPNTWTEAQVELALQQAKEASTESPSVDLFSPRPVGYNYFTTGDHAGQGIQQIGNAE